MGERLFAIDSRLVELDPEKGVTPGEGRNAGKAPEIARFDNLFDSKPGSHPPLIEPAVAAGRFYLPVGSTIKVLDLKTLKLLVANPCGSQLVGAPMPSGNSIVLRTTKQILRIGQ